MTEKSWFWDGIVTGDSSFAPYNAQEFNTWIFSSFLSNNLENAYIIPNYLENLWVRSAGVGTHSIVVNAGAAVFNNVLYILDAPKTIAISQVTVGQYRRDVVVLRLNKNTNQIRLAIVEGTPSAYSTFASTPPLTQTASIYEVALATVFVEDNTYIDNKFVLDKRIFIYNAFTHNEYDGINNLVRNSEWQAFSDLGATHIPDEWTLLSPSGTSSGRTASTMGSGRNDWFATVGFSTSEGMAQWIKVHGKTFTVKVPFVNGGFLELRGIRKNGLESVVYGAYYDDEFIGFNTPKEISFTTTFPEDDIEKIYLFTNLISMSQCILVPGFHAGGYRAIPEIIPFTRAVPDAAWTATAKSTGATTINFGASFGTLIKNYTRAVILRLRGRDSGSAAAASCYMYAQGYAAPFNSLYGLLRLEGVTNDVWRETTAIVPVDQIYFGTGVAGAQLRLYVSATGAGTFDATVEVVGIII